RSRPSWGSGRRRAPCAWPWPMGAGHRRRAGVAPRAWARCDEGFLSRWSSVGVPGAGLYRFARIAGADGPFRHVAGDDGAGADDGTIADMNPRKDKRRGADEDVLADLDLPHDQRQARRRYVVASGTKID